MELITEEEIEQLRAIAERVRERNTLTGYGYFPGGDPREFTPDPECCSEDEIANHKRACELYERGEVKHVSGRHHDAIVNAKGETIGWSTSAPFGIGTYSLGDGDADSLANDLDTWIDRARAVEDRYR